MKEEGKYYTPSYDEFHIGFNYEYYNEYAKPNGTWEKVELIEFCDWFVHNFDLEKSRVKHLDKQDIIDLGWEHLNTLGSLYGFMLNGHHLAFDEETKKVIIAKHTGVVFDGNVKNKSELKKMMKMLEIF